MKVIVAGATGRIGGACLARLLSNVQVTEVVVLARRAVSADSPKLRILLLTDVEFLSYPPHILKELEGAIGCSWAMGANSFPTLELARKVTVDYPLAAATAFASLPPSPNGQKFRFLYSSGTFVPEDPKVTGLWFLGDHRRMGSETCQKLQNLSLGNENLDVIIAKPGGVMGTGMAPPAAEWIMKTIAPSISIQVVPLAAAEVDVVLNGSDSKMLQNDDLKVRGQKALNNV
ncbi:hypothetical protein C8F04DRAFT_1101112 [Mycena alexandri]|uniref:NAD(P)-binding domain-containing protein n=1 Tax=Mycena alexandri TaxID=1745969 RepID=A0AAD6X0W9_9AGAR|nr:hypothetical protein C8F04DRAFT_1101112 [Mycena alexandri]